MNECLMEVMGLGALKKLGVIDHEETLQNYYEWFEKVQNIETRRNDESIMAGLVYFCTLVSGTRRTQREVADIFDVSVVTVRNSSKELGEKIDSFNNKIQSHYGLSGKWKEILARGEEEENAD